MNLAVADGEVMSTETWVTVVGSLGGIWLTYGILLRARAVIIANFATAIVIALATALKAWTARRDAAKEVILAAVERG
jgi:hypothetical protein